MTSDALIEFGYAIRTARLGRGWSLEDSAHAVLGNGDRKGYVSQVEKGQRNLSPETIDKFDQALDLPDEIVKAAHMAPPLGKPAPEQEKLDHDVERLMARAAKDETAPQMAETLMVALAYEFAGGKHLDLQTAYIGLRGALEAAERIRQRGEMPPDNTGSQLNAVLAEVAKLNAEGQLDAADDLLEAEERRMLEAHKAEKDRIDQQAQALLDRRLDQDRLRNDPKSAAERLIRDLIRRAPPGGVWRAVDDLLIKWNGQGEMQGDPFDLRVALVLANRNYERAKGPQKGGALISLGTCRCAIGERSAGTEMLISALKAIRLALKTFPKSRDLRNWAACQGNLGIVLVLLGERTLDRDIVRSAIEAHTATLTVRSKEAEPLLWATSQNNLGGALQRLGELEADDGAIEQAIAAYRATLTVWTKADAPRDWAKAQNNLAVALRWLGALTGQIAPLDEAEQALTLCLTERPKDNVPFNWAQTQWNLGDLALVRFGLVPDAALLDAAASHVRAARDVFADGSDHQTDRCDTLLDKIAEARAGLGGAP